MSELGAVAKGDTAQPYVLFVVVFLFFITGLLGFLVCHLLKKKGYHCRAGDMEDEEDGEEALKESADDEEENQDTVEQILKCIIENEANMEALNEMLGNQNVCVHHDPRVRKESLAGVPPHHHTVHSGVNINSCHLCAQVRSKKDRRHSKTSRFKQRPGEQTVLSVGRFRVTHTDKKLHGGSNSLAGSGNQLDHSQDSDDRKESGYNLRSMFRDAPPQASNGPAQNAGKRRRSLTIFGLRRGSDATGARLNEGAGKEVKLGRFGVQQQPVVLEEVLQMESQERSPTLPPPLVSGATESERQNSSNTGSDEPTSGPPQSLTIPLITVPEKTPTSMGDALDNRVDDMCDPGPQQTSTPILPELGLSEAKLTINSGLKTGSSSSSLPADNFATSPVSDTPAPNSRNATLDLAATALNPPSPASGSPQFRSRTPGSGSRSLTSEENKEIQQLTPDVMVEKDGGNRAGSSLPLLPVHDETPVTSTPQKTSPGTNKEFDVLIPDGESEDKSGESVGSYSLLPTEERIEGTVGQSEPEEVSSKSEGPIEE